MTLRIALSNTSGTPIYEQIRQQVVAAILSGELAEGEALPSIRVLARDLRVSVITTTRAYGELAADGYIANVPGKGSYVLPRDTELVREQVRRDIEELFAEAVAKATLAGLDAAELHAMLDVMLPHPGPTTSPLED